MNNHSFRRHAQYEDDAMMENRWQKPSTNTATEDKIEQASHFCCVAIVQRTVCVLRRQRQHELLKCALISNRIQNNATTIK